MRKHAFYYPVGSCKPLVSYFLIAGVLITILNMHAHAGGRDFYYLSEDCNPMPISPGKHMTIATNHLIPEVLLINLTKI